MFPEQTGKFADFGQNSENLELSTRKFPQKFPEAGNFADQCPAQI
jgi:hypothetical protein